MKFGLTVILSLLSGSLYAGTNTSFQVEFPRWAASLRGGSVYNLSSDLSGGGSFSVNRFIIEGMYGYMWDYDTFLALAVGGGQDDYHFSDGFSDPWNNINNYRIGFYGQWRFSEHWKFYAAPQLRAYAEERVNVKDGLTSAIYGGISYILNDRLTVGPGLAVVGQIDDPERYYPFLLVDWYIKDDLLLSTGGGLAATAGPGLSLTYEFTEHWKIGVTGRYERKRFRLDGNNIYAPDGVGEDVNLPVYGMLAWFPYPQGYITLIAGHNTYGELSIEGAGGESLYKERYDPSLSLGFIGSFRF